MRNKFFLWLLAALLLPAASSGKTIVIYHTGDVHGHYRAQAVDGSTSAAGGFAVLSALVKKEKNPCILLDGGDWYQGTPEGNFTKGMASVQMMNMLGYKASVIGNHEYDYGEENLKMLVSSASFAVLGGNIKNKADGSQVSYAKPYTMVEIDGVKLGIIGIANERTPSSTLPHNVENLIFTDQAQTAAALADEVKKLGVNAAIALVHDGGTFRYGPRFDGAQWIASDKDEASGTLAVARAAKGDLAVVFGAHYHVLMDNGHRDGISGALLAESGSNLRAVSRVEMNFDDATGKFTGATDRVIDLRAAEIGEDAAVNAALEPVEKRVSELVDRQIAVAAERIPLAARPPDSDSPLGDLVCDIIRRHSGSEIVFQNTYGMRASLPQGPVTLRMVYEVLPFENTLISMTLSGAQLEDVMRENLRAGHSVVQASGMEAEYAVDRMGKISSLKISVGGRPVEKDRRYTVTTNSFLSEGGSGGEAISRGLGKKDTGVTIRDAFLEELKKTPALDFPKTGRLRRIKQG
ncbi:MAG: bifunctional UDP-sugar hydrolase/5'-nucleotidase [Elusimicrobiales bacterium]